jgi:ribonuclease HI
VLQTEALACLSGLRWASCWGMTKIRVETDSQMLFFLKRRQKLCLISLT